MSEEQEKNLKYGKLTAKEAGAIPWDILLVDIIGPYKIRREGHEEPLILKYLTIIYMETRWIEII